MNDVARQQQQVLTVHSTTSTTTLFLERFEACHLRMQDILDRTAAYNIFKVSDEYLSAISCHFPNSSLRR